MNENIITVTGNLCTPPELRQTRTGSPMLTFRVASTHRYFSNRSGQWEEGVANFYDVVAYRQLAVHAHKSLGKGDAVVLQGQFKTRRYERQDGSFGIGMEIEARLLGPDLAYGVASFVRAPRPQGRPAENRSDAQSPAQGSDPWVNQRTGEIARWGAQGADSSDAAAIDPENVAFDVEKDDEGLRSFPATWAGSGGSEQTGQQSDGPGDEVRDHMDEHEDEHQEELVGAAD